MSAWDLLLGQVEDFPEAYQARLDKRGWTKAKLATTRGQVRAVGEADDAQQERIAERLAQVKLCQQQEKANRHWYVLATRLCRRAAKKLPPDQAAEFRQMLGI
jgi:hypothetical protein